MSVLHSTEAISKVEPKVHTRRRVTAVWAFGLGLSGLMLISFAAHWLTNRNAVQIVAVEQAIWQLQELAKWVPPSVIEQENAFTRTKENVTLLANGVSKLKTDMEGLADSKQIHQAQLDRLQSLLTPEFDS